ncbi:MAG: hypothetical protein Q4E12_05655 [Coriobacteriia bacterium]|nr:hypothetical protein [Coriobacteriia bacterium]
MSHVFNCSTCGAQLVPSETVASLACPFCGNTGILPSRLEGAAQPAALIAFSLTKDQAKQALEGHWSTGALTVRGFKPQLQKITPVYIPFYLYSCDYHLELACVSLNLVGDDDFRRVCCSATFDRINLDASRGMPDDLMNALIEYDYSALKPFSYDYLLGSITEIADESRQACETRLRNGLQRTFLETNEGYVCHESFDNTRVEYVLLPAYLCEVEWEGDTHLVAVNGQTGAVASQGTSISKAKGMALFVAELVVILAVAVVVGVLAGTFALGSLAGIIATVVLLVATWVHLWNRYGMGREDV